jgi:fluoride exporter
VTWRIVAFVALGGAIGSVLRYVISFSMNLRLGAGFPWSTFLINILGSFFIGVVTEVALQRATWIGPELRLFLAVGVLGGFTTFSTFSLEIVGLIGARAPISAAVYAVASVVLGFAAAFGGLLLTRALVTTS